MKRFYSSILTILLAIAFLAVGLTAAQQAQAQTRQQEQELEQIAKRSMNGLSPQDRQRAIQIMTDVFVAQGMSKQQAAALAEANIDSMFSCDVGEMTPEQRRQFAEQQERLDYMERPLEQRIADALRAAGRNPGWPTANAFKRYGFTISKPNNVGDPVFSWVEGTDENGKPILTIYIEAKGSYSLKPEEMFLNETVLQNVDKAVASKAGTFDKNSSNNSYRYYERADPQRRNTSSVRYWINTEVRSDRSGGKLVVIAITLTTGESSIGAGGK